MKTAVEKIVKEINATIEYFDIENESISIKILGSNNQTIKWIEIEMDGDEIYEGTYDITESFYSLDELEQLLLNDKEFHAKKYKACRNFYGEITHLEAVYN